MAQMKSNYNMRVFYFLLLFSALLMGCSTSSDAEPEPETMEGTKEETPTLPILMGDFVSAAHTTEGTVELNAQRTQLNITGLKSDEGPLMELYLSTDLQATDYISLGKMQGFEGNYTYAITNAGDIDFTKHKYLMVWCVDFSINFGHAILK